MTDFIRKPCRFLGLFCLKTLLTEQARQASMKDFASLFSRDNMYGNIENGIGIFGAKTEQELPWYKHNEPGSWNVDFEW